MHNRETQDHHLVTIYGDSAQGHINALISSLLPEKDTRILTPRDEAALAQAAQHSSVIIIGLQSTEDKNVLLARKLKDNRLVVAEVFAVILGQERLEPLKMMAKGFDACVSLEECRTLEFKSFLKQQLIDGTRRLNCFIVEEEYRRFSDALSCAPASVIVFDQEKRIVFVSEHYYRAYPQSAPRLTRGLSVYEAFDMMSKEEEVYEGDPRYEEARQFWYNLSGDMEFSLDNGASYRIKAVALPNNRGTIVTAQNITEYVQQAKELKKALEKLKKARAG